MDETKKHGRITRTDQLPPGLLLAEAMLSPHGHIEKQEEHGQRELVDANQEQRKTLPTDGLDGCPWATNAEIVEGDPLFSLVTLPGGWSVRKTSHSMWSDVIDDRGRRRAGVFYKAAFYDRRAHVSLALPITVLQDYDAKKLGTVRVEVIDNRGGFAVFRVEEPVAASEPSWQQAQRLHDAAESWLLEQGIDHRDQSLWDQDPLPEVTA